MVLYQNILGPLGVKSNWICILWVLGGLEVNWDVKYVVISCAFVGLLFQN